MVYNLETHRSETFLDGFSTSVLEWSADGQTIAVPAAPLDAPFDNPDFDVHLIDVATQAQINLTPNDLISGGVSWSSDDQRVGYITHDVEENRWRVATASRDGSQIETFALGRHPKGHPEWVFMDQSLVYGEYLPQINRLWLVSRFGGEPTMILEKERLAEYQASPDGTQIAYVGWNERNTQTMLCIYDLNTSTDTCYHAVTPDPNAVLVWID